MFNFKNNTQWKGSRHFLKENTVSSNKVEKNTRAE